MSITLSGGGYRHTIHNQDMYSDNTPMLKVPDFLSMVALSHTMTIRHTSMAEFINAMLLVDAIRANGGRVRTLVLPYIPGARQDRSNPTGDVLFTIASVARMLNERMFNRVVVLDPHSITAVNLIHRVVVYPQESLYERFSGAGYDGVIATDKGGWERAMMAADVLGIKAYAGGKTRDVATGRLSGFTLDKIPTGRYLVVDDICDGGGTFIGLGEKIYEQGSYADLFVSHGIFSKGLDNLLDQYDNIYTTDSIVRPYDDPRVTVIPVVEDMEKYNG